MRSNIFSEVKVKKKKKNINKKKGDICLLAHVTEFEASQASSPLRMSCVGQMSVYLLKREMDLIRYE